MTALILQARLDSSRLPGKSLLPLGGEPLIYRVMEALAELPCTLHILACPEDAASAFKPLAARAGFELFTGPKEDVLGRYAAAIRHFGLSGTKNARIIRATGDNPFVFVDAAAALDRQAHALKADYAGYAGLPYGAGVESVLCAALLRAEQEAADPYEREHVCPYLYQHGTTFRLHRPCAPLRWQYPALRLTVDNAEDYRYAAALYAELAAKERTERFKGQVIIAAAGRLVRPAV